jgi:hypothetical protein
MTEERIQRVVVEVLKRLLPHIGATGDRGSVIVVFTGATVGYNQAIEQVRALVMKGYRVQLVFSRGAEALYGKFLRDQLDGFPYVTPMEEAKWLHTLKESCAVAVPMLSLNTLSKLALLLADNFASNIILHALFAGKPVLLARNGVDPSDKGREIPHFDKCGPVMAAAIEERLRIVGGYGCRVSDAGEISNVLTSLVERQGKIPVVSSNGNGSRRLTMPTTTSSVVTAADVLQAHHSGTQLRLGPTAVVTPLARELAVKHAVSLVQAGAH